MPDLQLQEMRTLPGGGQSQVKSGLIIVVVRTVTNMAIILISCYIIRAFIMRAKYNNKETIVESSGMNFLPLVLRPVAQQT